MAHTWLRRSLAIGRPCKGDGPAPASLGVCSVAMVVAAAMLGLLWRVEPWDAGWRWVLSMSHVSSGHRAAQYKGSHA
jgi:hypothetical protein